MSSDSFTNIIENIFRRNGGWLRLKGELSVYFWPKVAGPEIASKVEAVRYRSGFLYLQTENPVLAHQISLFTPDILQRFQKILGKGIVKGVKIKVGSVSNLRKNHGSPLEQEYFPTEQEQRIIEECCKNISDPDLSIRFGKLMRSFYHAQKQILDEEGNRCSSCRTVISGEYSYCPCCQRDI